MTSNLNYKIPIFLSYPKPFLQSQNDFIDEIAKYLDSRGLMGRTLGVTDYDLQEPLTAIRRLMLECHGLITIAFRRVHIQKGIGKPASDLGDSGYSIDNTWLTSPYCQIEPAMAFQIGLPILIIRERGVIADGILEKGVSGTYLPEVDIEKTLNNYLKGEEWKQLIGNWEGHVRAVVQNKGKPPKLY